MINLFLILLLLIASFLVILKWWAVRKRNELFKLYWQNYRISSVYIEIYEERIIDCDEDKKLQNQLWLNMFKRFNSQTNTFLVKLREHKQTWQDQSDMLLINKVLREHFDNVLPLHWQDDFDQVAKPLLGWTLTLRELTKS